MQIIKASMQQAKDSLKHKWHKVILVFCVVAAAFGMKALFVSLVSFIFSQGMSSLTVPLTAVISLLFIAFELFCFCPLYIGAVRWLWQTVLGADEPFDTVFYYYETKADYKKAIEIGFNFLWRIYGYFILCSIPFTAMTMVRRLISGSLYFGIALKAGAFFGWILFAILGAGLFITLVSRHFLVLPVIFSDDNIDAFDAFRLSSIMSKGRVSSVMYMVLRFIPLFALCLLAVPIVWVVPYFVASVLSFAKSSIEDIKAAYRAPQN